jgi:tRNA pseudouridine55 synthase
VEPFEDAPLVGLDALEAAVAAGTAAALLRPVADGLVGWRRLDVDAAGERRLRQGQPLPTAAGEGAWRVHGPDGGLLALADAGADGMLRVRRVFAAGA